MTLKILIMEELFKDLPTSFNGYIACCIYFNHEYSTCHDLDELPTTLDAFLPDILIWIMNHAPMRDLSYLKRIRREYKDIKIVSASFVKDFYFRELVNYHFFNPLVSLEQFQDMITRLSSSKE